ncbi:hypothetical protein O6H91_Y308600 [Diphasiastrum complanatum]|nr:hypothetical protein O6H91_Y308600 [Diphasiastrum complanatum]
MMAHFRVLSRAEAVAMSKPIPTPDAAARCAGARGMACCKKSGGVVVSLRVSLPRPRKRHVLFPGGKRVQLRRQWPTIVLCSNCGKSGGDNDMNKEIDNADYALAHVVDAVSMVPLQGQLFMTLANGREVEVDHINPAKGRLLYRSRNPTIFLKIAQEELILPIVVGEIAVAMLIRALHDDDNWGRPNHYQLLRDVFGTLNYEVRMVRVTERVVDTYYARIYFSKEGDHELHSVDSRPSDAINLAVRCKVPIYVNKKIVDADAVRPVYASNWAEHSKNCQKSSSLDSPDGEPDPIAEEITLLRDMLVAVVEERYRDAARCRDQLNKLRVDYKGKLRQALISPPLP